MTVSWRHIMVATASIAALSTAGLAFAGGSGSSSGGQTVNVPGVTIGATSGSGSTCCGQGQTHGIYAPGVTIPSPNLVINQSAASVGSQYIIEQGSFLESGVTVQGADTRTTFLSNRSYIPMADPIEPSALDGLSVKGSTTVRETVTEQVPHQEEVCVETIVEQIAVAPVRAVCLDDTGTPHPASRVDDAPDVHAAYNGEVFRCVAGTSMQVTIGSVVNGQADFTSATGFSCGKGEALVHKSGGELSCAPEIPQRNCNERSLLRKYGPGIKLIQTRVGRKVCEPVMQTRYETVQREVVREVPLASSPITLDGGVGQIVTY